MTAFVTRYDFRAPGEALGRQQEMFARCLEQASYLQEQGQDAIVLSEHHATTDGYLPSPLVVAAAVAARTSTLSISVAALLANLYDPIRLAEDIAVLDNLANGRVTYTLGLGYRPEEYAMFDSAWDSRGADIERVIGVLQQAWTGDGLLLRGPGPLLGVVRRVPARGGARVQRLAQHHQVAGPGLLGERRGDACRWRVRRRDPGRPDRQVPVQGDPGRQQPPALRRPAGPSVVSRVPEDAP